MSWEPLWVKHYVGSIAIVAGLVGRLRAVTRNGVFWLGIILLVLTVYSVAKKKSDLATELSYSEFLQEVDKRNVRTVRIEGTTLYGEYRVKDSEFGQFHTTLPKDDTLIPNLVKNGVDIKVNEPADQSGYLLFIMNALPMVLLLVIDHRLPIERKAEA